MSPINNQMVSGELWWIAKAAAKATTPASTKSLICAPWLSSGLSSVEARRVDP